MSLEIELRAMLRDVVREVVREEIGARPTELQSELLTYAQAAEKVSVSTSTIKRWVKDGLLVARGKGRIKRVRIEDVRACLEGEPPAKPLKSVDTASRVTSILSSLPRRGA
ncbi:MAG: helix-turn-helix domain-containing protein [Archangium sp.]|nr:helix-turn-helix domain-containing protein [Archangium sp.]